MPVNAKLENTKLENTKLVNTKIVNTKIDKPKVVIGMLGSTLDGGFTAKRWERWRPTVSVCSHQDLLISRFELLYQGKYKDVCEVVKDDILQISPETEVRVHLVDFEDPWDLEEVYGALHDFAKSYTFRPSEEDYLMHMTTGTHVAQISTFLLTEARYFPAKLLQTSPSRDSAGTYRIIDLDLSVYDKIATRFQKEKKDSVSFLKSGIETKNAKFNQLIEQIEKVAIASKDPMLLMGPTGAGKSQLARKVYELKKSRGQIAGDFVYVNCATLRGDSAMSALFGHTKGAFTGAVIKRQGHLLSADKGVLFLDEIGELGADEQAMLLRGIEDKVFYPVGSDTSVRSNFQLIAGTNLDLRASPHFRKDLLARIDLWAYTLPGLADRVEDIAPNLAYELEKYRQETAANITMTTDARKIFLEFAKRQEAKWYGNFRDLNAAVRRMATLCVGGRIVAKDVAGEIQRLVASWRGSHHDADLSFGPYGHQQAGGGQGISNYIDPESLDLFDSLQLAQVLSVCESSRSLAEAGKKLFPVSRSKRSSYNDSDRIRKYLQKFGISWEDVVEVSGRR